MAETLLSQIRKLVTVDVDSMDPTHAAAHTSPSASPPVLFCDMTSNQAILGGQAARTDNADLMKEAIAEVKEGYKDRKIEQEGDVFAQDVIDVLTVLVAKRVYPYLTGNVHAQTSPSAAYDVDKTVAHAKKLVELFEKHGIPKSRVCIKIPTSAESMVACKKLKDEDSIQTLATCLFSVSQALAAHQAGCVYVAPYFNELRVHFEPTIWREYANPGKEHPMSQVIFDVKDVYRKIGSKTLVMPASLVTVREIIGLVSLKPDHITISGGLLDKLAELPPEPAASFETDLVSTVFAESELAADYLANNGALLKESLARDAESTRKLDDALKLFDDCEKKTKELILEFVKKD